MNRQLANAFVLSGHSESLLLDLPADLVEVSEALVDMEKLAPFRVCWCRLSRSGFRDWRVDELKHKGSSCDNALPSGKEVASNDAIRVEGQQWNVLCELQ